MATGVTTGPFIIVPGTALALDDPRTGITSSFLQLQNNSGTSLSVLSGTDYWTITANQSSTIPVTGGGAAILVTPSAVGAGGLLTAVWLLDGQDAPQPDGPLTGSAITPVNVVSGVAVSLQDLPGPDTFTHDVTLAASTVAVIATLTYVSGFTNLGDGELTLSLTGDTTSVVYATARFDEAQYRGGGIGTVVSVSATISGATESGVTFAAVLSGSLGTAYQGTLNVVAYEASTGGTVNYASLSGPGQSASPGALTQNGGFSVTDATGESVSIDSTANVGISSSGGYVAIIGTTHVQIESGGSGEVFVAQSGDTLAFFGAAGDSQQASAGITTVAQLVTVLKNYGLLS